MGEEWAEMATMNHAIAASIFGCGGWWWWGGGGVEFAGGEGKLLNCSSRA